MSFDPFGHSSDLARLAGEGFELEVTAGGHLLVKGVPYCTSDRTVASGVLVTKLEMNGDITVNPVTDHTVRFIGDHPCRSTGEGLPFVINSNVDALEPELTVNHHFSARPDTPHASYYEKVLAYVGLMEAEAQAINPLATARTHRPCIVARDDCPFEYVDTASGRAGTGEISGRLAGQRIAIVGLGGTGSYILDLVAKCPVKEIHLFDADRFSTHNAFRAPGAPSLSHLREGPLKVEYFRDLYSNMKRKVEAHTYSLTSDNVAAELTGMSFVFLAMEGGAIKKEVAAALETMDIPFVDVAVGVVKQHTTPATLNANIDVTASTKVDRRTFQTNVDFGAIGEDDPYTENIQIAELNALNATLAVMWWKKWSGIYYSPNLPHHLHLNVAFNRVHTR